MRDFLVGARFLAQGFQRYGRRPGLVVLGVIPALLTLALFAVLFAALIYFLSDVSNALTWFADEWSAGWRLSARIVAGLAVLGGSALVALVSFTAVTLLIGDPFYEKIAESIEDELGGVPDEVYTHWLRGLTRSLADSARLLLRTAAIAVPLFLGGFIPVLGQTVIPVLGALVGGWFLAQELVGVAFSRRGKRLPDRRRALREHRATALGFGTVVFVCFLIPFGAVIIMPAAVAGGTLLARHVLGLPTTR